MIKIYRFRWHRRWQWDIDLGGRRGFLSIGWQWRQGSTPVLYWSPDAVGINERARGPWRRLGY